MLRCRIQRDNRVGVGVVLTIARLSREGQEKLDTNGLMNLGVHPAQDLDMNASDYLVTEYVVWKGHKWGESTRPEDNLWDLSGYVVYDLRFVTGLFSRAVVSHHDVYSDKFP